MHLALQNAETINRLVEQGEFLLTSFHDEHQKEPAGLETEFAAGAPRYTPCTVITRKTS